MKKMQKLIISTLSILLLTGGFITPVMANGNPDYDDSSDEKYSTDFWSEETDIFPEEYLGNPLARVRNGWVQINGFWYSYNHGVRRLGWHNTGGNYYFLHQTTGRMQVGWVDTGGHWYFLNNSGRMQTNWVQPTSSWYFLNPPRGHRGHRTDLPHGAMHTGWSRIPHSNSANSVMSYHYFLGNRNGRWVAETRFGRPFANGRVSNAGGSGEFGACRDNGARRHAGIDLISNVSLTQPILAGAPGYVHSIRNYVPAGANQGRRVIIRHEINGRVYFTLYAHLSRVDVSVGQRVNEGTRIGAKGNSGATASSTGHLHFEVHPTRINTGNLVETAVAPRPFLNITGINNWGTTRMLNFPEVVKCYYTYGNGGYEWSETDGAIYY